MDLTDLASLTPLAGGWSGRTFVGEVAGDRVIVRVYPPGERGDVGPEIDAALLSLVRGLLPVPEVVEVVRCDPTTGRPGLLLTSFVAGARGDLLLPGLDDSGLATAGRSVGEVAAALAAMPMQRAGAFVDADLAVGELGGPDDLPGWVESRLGPDEAWQPLLERLLAVADDAQQLLDETTRRCLVHSDLNPKNLLLDPVTLQVTGVVDWEFAHAGHPATDLGNLLRFDRSPAYVGGVLDAWTARHQVDREVAVQAARSADLWALVDLAARAGSNPVADRAAALLRRVAESGDVSG